MSLHSGQSHLTNVKTRLLSEKSTTKKQLHLPQKDIVQLRNIPKKAKDPEIIRVLQPAIDYREGDFEGIKLYASRALLRARLPALARALEVLRDQNMLGKEGITFAEFSACVEYILGPSATRAAWDSLNGRRPNQHQPKGKYNRDATQNQAKFLELLMNFSLSSFKNLRKSNFHQKTQRGRPIATIRLPSEGELDQLLLYAGLIEDQDINNENVWKSEASLRSTPTYRAIIGVGAYVESNGERQYARHELAKLTGCSIAVVRKDATRVDMRVEVMPVIRCPFKDEDFDCLPADHVELEWAQKNGLIPPGRHFQTYLGDKSFEYTKKGYLACKETGTKQVMDCEYQASKYYPTGKIQTIK